MSLGNSFTPQVPLCRTYAQMVRSSEQKNEQAASLKSFLLNATQTRLYYNPLWLEQRDVERAMARLARMQREAAGKTQAETKQETESKSKSESDTESESRKRLETETETLKDTLTADEAIRSRKKVLAQWGMMRNSTSQSTLPPPVQFVIVLHAATIQMDNPFLESTYFILSGSDARVQAELEQAAARSRRPTVQRLSPAPFSTEPRFFDAGAYRACIAEDLCLILAAFEAEVARTNAAEVSVGGRGNRRGFLKLPAFGLSPHVALADGTVVGELMFAPFLAALRDVLCSKREWPAFEAIELPDFLGGAFTPRYNVASLPVRLLVGPARRRDILEFSEAEAAEFVCGVVAPCSVLAPPGHALARGLERIIAEQVMFVTQNLDSYEMVPTSTSFRGRATWWPLSLPFSLPLPLSSISSS